MEHIAEGTYDGVTKSAVLYEAKSGALMAVIDIDMQGRSVKGWITLVQKDGTMGERGLRDIMAIMGWVSWDWSKFEGDPLAFGGRPVSVVMADEVDPQTQETVSRVKYVNPPGYMSVQRADAKSMAAKYGASARAILGGNPHGARPATPPAAAPAVRPARFALPQPNLPYNPPAPPLRRPLVPPVEPSTMEECWIELHGANSNVDDTVIETAWFAMVAREFPGAAQTDITPADWGKFLAVIHAMPPLVPIAAPVEPGERAADLPF